jgi:F-type H+-transporting ATPase subunit b
MNNVLSGTRPWFWLIGSAILVLCWVVPSWAGESPAQWRPVYDLVMRWINFGILAFVVVRYGGPPLVNFLRNQKTEIQSKIDQVQQARDEMTARVQEAQVAMRESATRLDEIKARIIEMGEHKKQEIIEESKSQSRLMMESARHRIDYQIHQAAEKLRIELLDMAISMALEKLPHEITDNDNQKFIENYLAAATALK